MSDTGQADSREKRFSFGENWSNFLSVLNEERIQHAVTKLSEVLGSLEGKTFLDIGSGSGIHSLAAVRLGARQVFSFDYDPQSVDCTKELKRRYAPSADWRIEQGSVLDGEYMRRLGNFDVVYSWGVLHHTGDMWRALENAALPMKEKLMVAIYNDQGWKSNVWRRFKQSYNAGGPLRRRTMECMVFAWAWINPFLRRPRQTIKNWREYSRERGMSPWYDVVDWAGGYPFEVSTPGKLISFYEQRGLKLHYSLVRGSSGCNDFVFIRPSTDLRK